MVRCWPSGGFLRSKKAAGSTTSGKDSGSNASGSITEAESDSKAKTEHNEKKAGKAKEKKAEKKEAKKDEDKDGDKDEKKDESTDESKEGEEDKKDDKPKVAVGSISEAKNIYKGASDDDGNWTWVDKYPDDVEEAAENEETATYAVVVRNQKSQDSRKKLEAHSIIVQSPWLRNALSEIMGDYPGVACELTRLEFETPFKPFVHRWAEFMKYMERDDLEEKTKEHLKLLHKILDYEIGDNLKSFQDYVRNGVVSFKNLWMIFQPGAVVLSAYQGPLSAFEVAETEYMQNQCGQFLQVRCDCVDYSGKTFGRYQEAINISEFVGTKKITGLKVYPLIFHEEKEKVVAALTKRGELFEKLAGHHYKQYSGKAITWNREGNEVEIQITGRIIVDIDSFNRFSYFRVRYLNDWNPRDLERFTKFKEHLKELEAKKESGEGATDAKVEGEVAAETAAADKEKAKEESKAEPKDEVKDESKTEPKDEVKDEDKKRDGEDDEMAGFRLTPYHHMLARSRTRGYSLKFKKWLDFFVEQISEVTWNTSAFDRLVLPPDQKELILAFSESQLAGSSFDDVISGKGKGIICLLSGPPGVGKTLTAEAVAENLRVPLHMLSSGDLGSDPWEVERELQSILELVARWNAILLLDECDVFLEARSTHELERNKIVSIFLRTLEYYEGIMFMTTNRVDDIDAAFQSRIHVSIEYPDLTSASRRTIWANFLNGSSIKSSLTDKDIAELAELKLNGRQIKNVLKTAQLLAARKKSPTLDRKYIETILVIEKKRPGAPQQMMHYL